MKFARKCPICHREATKRVGKLDFCDTHAKEVHKTGTKEVWTEVHVLTLSPRCAIYTHYPIKVY